MTGTTGAAPIDAAVSRFGGFLYTLDSGSLAISGFAVQSNGSLVPVSGASGLPAGANGLAAL